jgi:hypothetical protein
LHKPKDGPDTRFKFKSGNKAIPYGQWRLASAQAKGYIILAEGASDCHTLWYHDEPALGFPGADSWKDDRDAPLLEGIERIYVLDEQDRGGDAVRKWLATSSVRNRVWLVRIGGDAKDPSALYLADPERFRENWRAALETATSWADIEQEGHRRQRFGAWNACADLARTPEILDELVRDLRRLGMVGEERQTKIIYLAITSRLLERPSSVAIKGPSGGGKSYIPEMVGKFYPARIIYSLTGMSEKALVYDEEPLSHRMLAIYEAAGLASEFGSYLVRSLLSEGHLRYTTVEKTAEGLRARTIEREGPTGLILTTTAIAIHPENETRILSLTVTDTAAQTAAIMTAQAQDRADSPVDFAPWHALSDWLADGETRITIPYAPSLAKLIPPVAVRLRRDFPQILNLIRAHALLHRATRLLDQRGRIVATLADYGVVRDLAQEFLSDGLGVTVPKIVRETVEAVEALKPSDSEGVKGVQVARHLKIDKAAASRRIATAVRLGFLKNLETRKGQPARLVLGDPLPDDVPLLPHPDAVARLTTVDEQDVNRESRENSGAEGSSCAVDADSGEIKTPPPRADAQEGPRGEWVKVKPRACPERVNDWCEPSRDDAAVCGFCGLPMSTSGDDVMGSVELTDCLAKGAA